MVGSNLLPQMEAEFHVVDVLGLLRVELQNGFVVTPEQRFHEAHLSPVRCPGGPGNGDVLPAFQLVG